MQKSKVEVSLAHYKKRDFNGDINKKHYDDFLEYLAKTLTPQMFNRRHRAVHDAFEEVFANKQLDTITKDDICLILDEDYEELAKTNDGIKECAKMLMALTFIIFLIENNVKIHESLQDLIIVKDIIVTSKQSYKKIYDIFKEPNKEKYYVVPLKNISLLFYIDIENKQLANIIKEFLTQHHSSAEARFVENLPPFYNHVTLEDLNFETFRKHLNYIQNLEYKGIVGVLTSFYYFVGSIYKPDIFKDKNLDLVNITRSGFAQSIQNGYEVILYNPKEDVPQPDKWILVHNNKNVLNTSITKSGTVTIDFTQIKEKTYRNWVKAYIWKDIGTKNPINILYTLGIFCNFISDVKTGKRLIIYSQPTKEINLSLNEIFAYRSITMMEDSISENTKYIRLYHVKLFLNFLHKENIAKLPDNYDYPLLNIKTEQQENSAICLPDEDIIKIANLMIEDAENDVIKTLYCYIYYILLETEFRVSQVLSLTTDCIKETSKPNEYVLVSRTKTSAGEKIGQNIPLEVKRHIDEIIKLTQSIRETCPDKTLSKYLFLIKTTKYQTSYKILTTSDFAKYLKKCCKKLALPEYTPSHLRDTHMTRAESFVIKNNLSDAQQNILTGHKSPTVDNKHYIDPDVKQLLESVHGVIIGDVDINGQIVTTNNDVIKPENEVSNGCGYCNGDYCKNHIMLGCMMCENFVTTPDRLPYFEEQIKILDYKIQQSTIPHDKEDLYNIKRLHMGFMAAIGSVQNKKGD